MEKIPNRILGTTQVVNTKGYMVEVLRGENDKVFSEIVDKVNEIVEKINKLEKFTGKNLTP